jgi:hypothetical protein
LANCGFLSEKSCITPALFMAIGRHQVNDHHQPTQGIKAEQQVPTFLLGVG